LNFQSSLECDILLKSISPKIFANQKVAGERRVEKNSKFNFINKVVRLKLSQNLPYYVRHSPNAIRQMPFAKTVSNLVRAKNSRANVDEIDPLLSELST
jgi:hypothetical protein